jgi:hypothetical protein
VCSEGPRLGPLEAPQVHTVLRLDSLEIHYQLSHWELYPLLPLADSVLTCWIKLLQADAFSVSGGKELFFINVGGLFLSSRLEVFENTDTDHPCW